MDEFWIQEDFCAKRREKREDEEKDNREVGSPSFLLLVDLKLTTIVREEKERKG